MTIVTVYTSMRSAHSVGSKSQPCRTQYACIYTYTYMYVHVIRNGTQLRRSVSYAGYIIVRYCVIMHRRRLVCHVHSVDIYVLLL